jgi:protoheme IX farnesyltransferase
MAFGLGLAAITLPLLALLLLAGACLSYLYLYTFWLKRRSPWGVLAGGIPGALPPLIGAAAVSGSITAPPLLLAGFVFIWQLPHFWLLALDCHDQYSRAGIPVLPLTHGESFTRICTLSATLLLLPVTLTLGLLGGLSSCFLAVAGVAGGIFSLYCARCLYQTHAYRRGFVASLIYILIIFAAICAG